MMLKSPKSIPILHSCNLPQKRQTNLLILEYCDLAITQINHLRFSFTNFFRLHVSTFLTFFLFTFAFLSAFGGFTTSYGQVKIKEKVEIIPTTKTKNFINNTLSESYHSLRFEMRWNAPQYNAYLNYGDPCREIEYNSGWQNGGLLTYENNNVKAGRHGFAFAINVDDDDDPYAYYKLFIDGNLVKEGSVYAYWGTNSNYGVVSYTTTFLSGLGFKLDDQSFCLHETNRAKITPGLNCKNVGDWIPQQDPITFSVVKGNGNVTFTDLRTNTKNLNMVTIPYNELYFNNTTVSKIVVESNFENYDPLDNTFIIRAQAGTLIEDDTISIEQPGIYNELKLEIGYQDIYCGELKYLELETDYSGSCEPEPLSSDITFNVSIINGQEYGHLINPNTGESSLSLSDLPHLDGQVILQYFADGVQPPSEGSKIRLQATSSSPNFPIVEKEMTIYPTSLIIEFSKEYLKPGETAEVHLYKRGANGEKLDFENDSEKLFYVQLYENMDYADIIPFGEVEGGDVYYYNIKQPFLIKANEEIDIDLIKVALYVETGGGIIIGGATQGNMDNGPQIEIDSVSFKTNSDTLKFNMHDRITKMTNIDKSNKINKKKLIANNITSIKDEYLWGFGAIDIKKGGCGEGAPVCDENIQHPIGFKEDLTMVTGDYTFIKEGYKPEILNLHSGGLTHSLTDGAFNLSLISSPNSRVPLKESFYSPYIIETCFNKNLENDNGAYQFSFKSDGTNDNYIHKPIIIHVADYSDDPNEMKSINDLSSIPSNKICKALVDFELHRYYQDIYGKDFWEINNVEYGIVDAYWEHEKYHVRQGIRILNEHFDTKLLKVSKYGYNISKTLKKHLQNTYVCSDVVKKYGDAKREGEKYIKSALDEYMKFFVEEIIKEVPIKFDGYIRVYKKIELYAQWSNSVQNKITYYQSVLASQQGLDPETCKYDLTEWYKPFDKYRNNL